MRCGEEIERRKDSVADRSTYPRSGSHRSPTHTVRSCWNSGSTYQQDSLTAWLLYRNCLRRYRQTGQHWLQGAALKMTQHPNCDYWVTPENFCAKLCRPTPV